MTTRKGIRSGARIRLEDREAFSLGRGPGDREIACSDGVIWVTFTGDPCDHLLRKGERIPVSRGTAVVSAIGKAELSIARPGAAPEGRALSLHEGMTGGRTDVIWTTTGVSPRMQP